MLLRYLPALKLVFLSLVAFFGTPVEAATRTVCAAGCDYTNANIQQAVNEASAVNNDVILLEQGYTYIVDLSLPVKTGAGPSNWVTIRTGVNSSGSIQPLSNYPSSGIRVCPQGFSQDWYDCSTRSPFNTSLLAKIQPATNNAYAIRTANTGSGTPVSHYELKWLYLIPNAFAGNALLGILNETAAAETDSSAKLPNNIKITQIVISGKPQFRGMQIDGNAIEITGSHVDIAHTGEGQGIWINTSTGPITLLNNYCSGPTECFLTGGGNTSIRPKFTVQASPSPTINTVTLSANTELYVGKDVAFHYTDFNVTGTTAANPTVITTSAAHNLTTGWQVEFDSIGTCVDGSGVSLNDFPFTVTVLTSTTFSVPHQCVSAGGAGVGRLRASAQITSLTGNQIVVSPNLPRIPSSGNTVETSLVINNLTVKYNVFTRPSAWRTSNPNGWQVKNTFEMKQGRNAMIEYNIIENAWVAGQAGPCVVFTGTQQNGQADSAVVRNITFRYNVVRHCAQWFQMTGTDALNHESGRSGDFTVQDNLAYDIGSPWGVSNAMPLGVGGGPRQHPNRAPYNMSFIHNTVHFASNSPNNAVMLAFCDSNSGSTPSLESNGPNIVFRDNIFYSGSYGFISINPSTPFCATGMSIGRVGIPPLGTGSVWNNNLSVGDANCGSYSSTTTNTSCPSVATVEANTFTNTTTIQGFIVKGTSPYYNAGTDGFSLGADIADLDNGIIIAESGDYSGGDPPLGAVEITTTTLPNGRVGVAYSQTLTVTNCVAPCVWSVISGSLPPGLSLNTSSGAITGTPTVSTTRMPTFRATGSDAGFDDAALSMTIHPAAVRGRSYGWSTGAHFAQGTAPVAADIPRDGDIWIDTDDGKLYVLDITGTCPTSCTITPTEKGAGGGGGTTSAVIVPFNAGAQWSTTGIDSTGLEQPAGYAGGRHRSVANLTGMTQCRVYFNQTSAAGTAGMAMRVEYSTDGSTWITTGIVHTIGTTQGAIVTSYQTLAAGARGDAFFRVWAHGGNGTTSEWTNHYIHMVCKP